MSFLAFILGLVTAHALHRIHRAIQDGLAACSGTVCIPDVAYKIV